MFEHATLKTKNPDKNEEKWLFLLFSKFLDIRVAASGEDSFECFRSNKQFLSFLENAKT